MKIYFNVFFTFTLIFLSANLSAQTGPGGIGSNDGTSTLKFWFDADHHVFTEIGGSGKANNGDRIRYWRDLSGNNGTATINIDKQRPTFTTSFPSFNGNAALLFQNNNGANDEFNALFTNTFPVSNNMTIYCVFHPLSPGGGTDTDFSGGADPNQWYYGAGLVDAEVNGHQNDIGLTYTNQSVAGGSGNGVNTDYSIKLPAALNQTHIACLFKNATSGNLELMRNGWNYNSVSAGSNVLDTPTRFGIGSTLPDMQFTGNYFNGYISNVIVFSNPINAAQKTILDNYLAAKYNIALTSNDFYSMDDPSNGNYDFDVAGIGQDFDNSNHTNSKGEGIIRIDNPRDLSTSEFLFWGHDNAPLESKNTSDVPSPFLERWQRTWRVSETGEVGEIDLYADLTGLTPDMASRLRLLVDLNNNGLFSDNTDGVIEGAVHISGNTFRFTNVNLQNNLRFTFALSSSFKEEKKLVLTPNADGLNDEFFIPETGTAKIYNRTGVLIKELQTPATWDGTNDKGELSTTGFYVIRINDDKVYKITVIR